MVRPDDGQHKRYRAEGGTGSRQGLVLKGCQSGQLRAECTTRNHAEQKAVRSLTSSLPLHYSGQYSSEWKNQDLAKEI